MEFDLSLGLQNQAELEARINAGEVLSRPALDAYLPPTGDYAKLKAWLVAQGFKVSLEAGTRHAIFVRGPVAKVAAVFKVRMARVATPDGEFTSAVTTPELPDEVAPLVEKIRGLQPHLIRHKHSQLTATTNGNKYITPAAVAAVYQAPTNLNGAGQTIAIVGASAVVQSDITTFWSLCGISQSWSNITQVNVGAGPGGPTGDQGELSLDVEWTSGIAPGAKIRVYETATPLYLTREAAAYTQILNDLPSNPSLHQVSESYAGNEVSADQSNGDTALVLLTAQGVTCFAASGDWGSNPNESGSSWVYEGALKDEFEDLI